MDSAQSVWEINGKILERRAVVLTEAEIKEALRAGADPAALPLDVAVVAFGAGFRGSAAMLLVPVAGRGVFTRAEKITLNGVPAYPGPAPNERLGVVDALVFADQTLEGQAAGTFPGEKLLLDFLSDMEIQAECRSAEGGLYRNAFTRAQLEFARFVSYNTFLPDRLQAPEDCTAALAMLRPGSKVLLNRSPGIIVGSGTRSRPGRMSLSLSADMLEMDRRCLDRDGEVALSVVIPIPVVDAEVKRCLCAALDRLPARLIPALDQEMAAYLKGLILDGSFNLTESSLPLRGFECRENPGGGKAAFEA